MKKQELLEDDLLEEILHHNSEEVFGLYMGDYYDVPTRIYDWRVEELVKQFKHLRDTYLQNN